MKIYRDKINAYQLAMHQAKAMLNKGIIDEFDYLKIEAKMAEKYCISNHSLYRLDYLITTPYSGNMCTDLEV